MRLEVVFNAFMGSLIRRERGACQLSDVAEREGYSVPMVSG
jgi:hypothetical protein